jgi:hypothetical protein
MVPTLDDAQVKRRYEGIYRAINRRNLMPLAACIGTTVLVAFAFTAFVVPLLVPLLPARSPALVVIGLNLAVFFVCVLTLPTLAQLLLTSREWRKAVETLNAWTLNERARWQAQFGRMPLILGRGSARRWIRRHPGVGGPTRIRLLAWIGELNAAAEITAALPTATPAQRFERRLLQAMIEFVATGNAGLDAARAEFAATPPGPERDAARRALGFEEARLAQAAGGDWVAALAQAREDAMTLPKGATIRERFVAGIPTLVGLIGLGAAVGLFLG